ncbi:unnamed protein product [Somion occarium]|uniref:Copper acquisition factor BIM1-like domain-containing protein n=1 Tax=Somion occarium TaxID=3059160 RepID=A0ABP1CP67_9APHY
MQFTSLVFLCGIVTLVSAHFQLQFPPPRGPFVEDDEPTFCDGYATAVSNRSQFPLNSGFISIVSEHPSFTVGLLLSTAQNPNNFANFSQAVQFFQAEGEGPFCFPIQLAAAGISGVSDGTNATLQVVFDGGDGKLYQCSDVVLSSSATIASDVSCTNSTGSTTTSSGSSTGTSSSAPAPTGTGASGSGAVANSAVGITALLSLVGAFAAML